MNQSQVSSSWEINAARRKQKQYEFLLSSLEPTPLPLPEHPLSSQPDRAFSSLNHYHFDDTAFLGKPVSFAVEKIPPSNELASIFETAPECDLGFHNMETFDFEINDQKLDQLRAQPRNRVEDLEEDFVLPAPTVYEKRPSFNSLCSSKRWKERYCDLVQYQNRFGHCCVPSQWQQNPPLAQWVKRQRYQLKLRKEGQHSTMSKERESALNKLGFVWDPHTAFWEERLRELEQFRQENGHANVPTKYPQNPQLAIWAKVSRKGEISMNMLRMSF